MNQLEQPIDMHAMYRMQTEAGFECGIQMHAHQVQSMAERMRAIVAVSAVLVSMSDKDMFKVSSWMQGGLVDAIHVIASDAEHELERMHERAMKEKEQ